MTHFTYEKIQNVDVIRFCFNEIGLQQREELKKELDSVAPDAGGQIVFNLTGIGFLSSLAGQVENNLPSSIRSYRIEFFL